MKFETLAPEAAVGARLAHSVGSEARRWRKGERLDHAMARQMREAGVERIAVARLEPGDLEEDEAARVLAGALAGEGLEADAAFTGRCNLIVRRAGLLIVDADRIDAFNAVDEAITVATAPAHQRLAPGDLAATVKIIPFAAPGEAVARALEAGGGALRLAPFLPFRVSLIATMAPGLKPSVADKTAHALRERLAPTGARLIEERRIPHEAEAVARTLELVEPLSDLVVLFGASAIADRRDVIPAGLIAAGGVIERLGMPVDPGNLLMLGQLAGKPILGAPGCARSPRENGFDWVLLRLLAGLAVTGEDLRRMGVGGLLGEIASRPQPRRGGAREGADG